MKKPLIGITVSYDKSGNRLFLRKHYTDAVEEAGGIPVILPLENPENIPGTVNRLDGILFSGGGDVSPSYYGEERIPECEEPTLLRDEYEIPLCRYAFGKEIPMFGICRGIQLMNVALGGTLWQDLPSRFGENLRHNHLQTESAEIPTHTVLTEKDSLLFRILGQEKTEVNSFHHQAVKTAGTGLIITGYSDDGVPEALEAPDRKGFFLGVQWHPEYTYRLYPTHNRLFQAFIAAAAEYN